VTISAAGGVLLALRIKQAGEKNNEFAGISATVAGTDDAILLENITVPVAVGRVYAGNIRCWCFATGFTYVLRQFLRTVPEEYVF